MEIRDVLQVAKSHDLAECKVLHLAHMAGRVKEKYNPAKNEDLAQHKGHVETDLLTYVDAHGMLATISGDLQGPPMS